MRAPIATSPHSQPANTRLQCPPLPSRPTSQSNLQFLVSLPPHLASHSPTAASSSAWKEAPCSRAYLRGGRGGGGWKEAPCSRAYLRGGRGGREEDRQGRKGVQSIPERREEKEEVIQGRGELCRVSSQASRCSMRLPPSLHPPCRPLTPPCRPLTRVSLSLYPTPSPHCRPLTRAHLRSPPPPSPHCSSFTRAHLGLQLPPSPALQTNHSPTPQLALFRPFLLPLHNTHSPTPRLASPPPFSFHPTDHSLAYPEN